MADSITPERTNTFRTSDGYTLRREASGMWTDGDMDCDADGDGWPVDRWGAKLEGEYVPDQ